MNVKEQEPEGRDFFAPAALRQSVFDPPACRIPAPAAVESIRYPGMTQGNYWVPDCFAAVQKMHITWTENEHAAAAKR